MELSSNNIVDLYKIELKMPLSTPLDILLPPYNQNDSKKTKILITQRALARTIQLKNRILALTNAFFLGLLLNEENSTSEKFRYKRKISKHYHTIAEYTYDIFELNPSHLLYTTTMNVQEIKKMKRREILCLRNVVQEQKFRFIFDGAQNLEEENC
jgi:hypothetical protein